MIHRDDRDGIAVLRMEHGKANAFDVELCQDLRQAFAAARDARAVVLTGTGTIFSAGVDLFRIVNDGPVYIRQFLPAFDAALQEIFAFQRPVVMAVNGHAIAGGCILACAGDHRVMASGRGTIGVPELLVGVPFPRFALEIIRFVVPSHHAQELAYTGRSFGPEDARHRGLVDQVVAPEQMLDRALEVAAGLAAIPADTFAVTKRMLRAPVLDRLVGDPSSERVKEIWLRPETRDVIRGYLARTLKK